MRKLVTLTLALILALALSAACDRDGGSTDALDGRSTGGRFSCVAKATQENRPPVLPLCYILKSH